MKDEFKQLVSFIKNDPELAKFHKAAVKETIDSNVTDIVEAISLIETDDPRQFIADLFVLTSYLSSMIGAMEILESVTINELEQQIGIAELRMISNRKEK